MRKILLFLIVYLTIVSAVQAQDLLVIGSDSLNCKITKEDKEYIYFTFKHKEDVRKTLIERSKVSSMQRNFYANPEVSKAEISNYTYTQQTYMPWRFGFSLGGGYRIASAVGSASSSYIDQLRLGFQFGADINYHFNNYWGLGAKFSTFIASASSYPNEDHTTTFYIGPVCNLRILSATKKNAFITEFSLGYLRYRDSGKYYSQEGLITANAFGVVLGIGYDIGLSKHVALGLNLSLLGGSFSDFYYNSEKQTLPNNQRENLGRIDFTIGIRFLG